jgi:hydrogenase-4 component E
MNIDILNAILVLVLVMNLFALGTSRLQAVIRIVAAQGALLGVLPLLYHAKLTLPAALASAAAIALKGVVIPLIMTRALRDAQIKREVEPLVGFMPSIILGAAATGFALLLASGLGGGQAETIQADLLIPASIATMLVGFILLTTRFKALSQVVGYLVLENGVYIFSVLLIEAIPLVVEMGVLLDLFVGIFVISIITNHINRAFASMDTRRLVSLKE